MAANQSAHSALACDGGLMMAGPADDEGIVNASLPFHARCTVVSVRQAATVHYPRAIFLRSATIATANSSASNAENIASAIQEGAMVGAGPLVSPSRPAPRRPL